MGLLILGILVYLFVPTHSDDGTETNGQENQQELRNILKEKYDLEIKLGTATQKIQ
jgi:hypothetical protein